MKSRRKKKVKRPEFPRFPNKKFETRLKLCKYCGGETIKIPTLGELASSVEALQWFYDIQIKHTHRLTEVPEHLLPLVIKIKHIYQESEQ